MSSGHANRPSVLGVIPARLGATRLPGKPLALLDGKPLVQRVHEAAAGCLSIDRLVVATDAVEVAEAVRSFGGVAELTRPDHPSGTDRVAEVAARYPQHDVVVNVQGDQPFVTHDMLDALVRPYLQGERPDMTTVAAPLASDADPADPNVVKVVCDRRGNALYFSRSLVPFPRRVPLEPVLHHLGLYAYSREFLLELGSLEPSPLEWAESLEQLRVLEHGHAIRVCRVATATLEVNTPDELAAAERLWRRGLRGPATGPG